MPVPFHPAVTIAFHPNYFFICPNCGKLYRGDYLFRESGPETRRRNTPWLPGYALRPTFSTTTAESRGRRLISLPRTMDSLSKTSLPTMRNITKRTERTTRTAPRDNHSWNCGAEGPTDNPAINALRQQQMKNLLATLLLSQGTPMMLASKRSARTQGGNNNAYCQDNEISWLNWDIKESGLRI